MRKQLLILFAISISIIGYSQTVGDTFIDNFITYEVTSIAPNTVEATDYNMTGGGAVNIPASVTYTASTFSVTTIGNLAFSANQIVSAIIPESVTYIGYLAFANNSSTITDIISMATTPPIIESGLNPSLGDHSIIDLTIPNGTSAVYASTNWTGFNSVTELLIVGDTFVVDYITYEVTSVTPNIVEAIDYNTAGGAVVNIPASVTHSVTTYSVASIGDSAFIGKGLTDVSMPNSITNIGSNAFASNQLTDVTIPNGLTMINIGVFSNNQISNLIIPNNVTSIAYSAFSNNLITSVNIPNSIAIIESGVFSNNHIASVTIPNSVTSIGSSAFSGNLLTSITIPNSVTSIGLGAFAGNQLTSITIPDSVTNIGNAAFINNPLTSVISLATTPPTINTATSNDTFANNRSNINLIIPNHTTDEYVTDSGALWTGFKMVFEATSPTTAEVSNYDPANGTSVVIPADVTAGSMVFDVIKIDDSAFENIGLTSVIIPDSVTDIGISAFNTNNLTSVTIPDSVTLIGTTAFATNAITNLSLGANVTDISIGAFVDNNLSDVTIPSNVTFIGLLAFGNNPLTSVTSLATTPPTITTGTNDTFAFNRSNIHLHIPPGTTGAYVTNPGAIWTGFNPVTEDALSISDFQLNNDIKLVNTFDELKVISSGSEIFKGYTIYSISGVKVKHGTQSNISIDTMSNGIYIIELNFNSGQLVKKFVK